MKKGLTHIYTGEGKGKTTAALGLAVRACGAGLRVAIVFFDKGGSDYSERISLQKLGVDLYVFGKDRRIDSQAFRLENLPEDEVEAKRAFEKSLELIQRDDLDLLILDEVLVSVELLLGGKKSLEHLLSLKNANLELVLTGRTNDKSIYELADLVSEVKRVKHYMENRAATRGIDF